MSALSSFDAVRFRRQTLGIPFLWYYNNLLVESDYFWQWNPTAFFPYRHCLKQESHKYRTPNTLPIRTQPETSSSTETSFRVARINSEERIFHRQVSMKCTCRRIEVVFSSFPSKTQGEQSISLAHAEPGLQQQEFSMGSHWQFTVRLLMCE